MIYVIQVDYRDFTFLKIGYTKDDNQESRYSKYKLHNPCCKVIFEVPEGTEELEHALHIYFKDHSYSDYGREWFKYSDEIYDFFVNYKTADDISCKLFHLISPIHSKPISKKVCYRILDKCLNIKLSKTIYSISEAATDREVLIEKIMELKLSSIPAIENNALLMTGVARSDFENYEGNLSENSVEFIEIFNSLSQFTDKMRLLCESGFAGRDLDDILNSIPLIFKDYYLTLGPEKIRNMQYKNSMIFAEYKRQKNNQRNSGVLMEQLASIFPIGRKLPMSNIKLILKDLYDRCNIKSTPKATDLEQYFELKIINLIDSETGKRVKGYEILSIKK